MASYSSQTYTPRTKKSPQQFYITYSEQTVHLRWSKFLAFLQDCREPDGPKELRAVSLGEQKSCPRLVFDGNRANLKAAIGDPRIRHKLSKALICPCTPCATVMQLFFSPFCLIL